MVESAGLRIFYARNATSSILLHGRHKPALSTGDSREGNHKKSKEAVLVSNGKEMNSHYGILGVVSPGDESGTSPIPDRKIDGGAGAPRDSIG